MPAYIYRRLGTDGQVTIVMEIREMIERQHAAQQAGERLTGDKGPFIVTDDGELARRDFRAEHVKTRPAGNWPMVCTIDGVHPDQVKEAEAASVEAGVPTRFSAEGGPIFDSPSHRKAYYEKVSGQYDRNAGYSDPVPRHR